MSQFFLERKQAKNTNLYLSVPWVVQEVQMGIGVQISLCLIPWNLCPVKRPKSIVYHEQQLWPETQRSAILEIPNFLVETEYLDGSQTSSEIEDKQ